MNKEIEQLEKEIRTINCLQASTIYTPTYQEALCLYNLGYRKTFTSDLASDTQKAFKEGYRKGFEDRADKIDNLLTKLKTARIEAVKDFAESLKEYARACKASGYDGIGENDIDELLKEFL